MVRWRLPKMAAEDRKFSWTASSAEPHLDRNRIAAIEFVGAAACSRVVLQNSRDK